MGFRYIGSKAQIIEQVVQQIRKICDPPAIVCDLMCGTGTVSLALANEGYRVVANDVMTFSYHHTRCALLVEESPQFRGAQDFIDKYYVPKRSLLPISSYDKLISILNKLPKIEGYFYREFSLEGVPKNSQNPRNYFSPINARKIDAVRSEIKKLRVEGQVTELEHSILIHNLIMAANDVANIAGTYGHYLSKLRGRACSTFEMMPEPLIVRNNPQHIVLQGYAEKVSSGITCDICYIDPPYMKRQYAANYHILETLAREDEPEAIGVSGLRPWRDQYSNFCTKTKIHNSFEEIFTTMDCPHFLISYSEDGLLTLNQLDDFFSSFGKVTVNKILNKRFKSNGSKLSSHLSEYIIHIERY